MMLQRLKKGLRFCVMTQFGDFQGSVTADVKNNALIINGTTVHVITANS
jgi:hypothetical protein